MTGVAGLRNLALQHFKDLVAGSLRQSFTHSNRHDAIEPVVFRRASFKKGHGAQIVVRCRHGLASGNSSRHFRRAMPNAAVRHQDQRVVVGSQGQPHVLLKGAVGPCDQQIRPGVWQDFTAQPLALKFSAGHRHDAAMTGGCGSQVMDGMQLDRDREQMTRRQLSHKSVH